MNKLMMTMAAATLAVSALAAPKAKPAAKPATPKTAVCPVRGEKIAKVTSATLSSTYKGKTYYFCCPSCKPQFDANPAKYLKASGKTTAKPAAKCPMK